MMKYATLKSNPENFKALTSLYPDEFEKLLPSFSRAWQEYLDQQEGQRTSQRQRKKGGGRRGQLKLIEDKLLFILTCFKNYPLQVVQGQLFGLSQGQANTWIHVLSPILKRALGYEKQLPNRDPQALAEILAESDTLDFMIDGTERRIKRPKGFDQFWQQEIVLFC
jgi:hypothetical protein